MGSNAMNTHQQINYLEIPSCDIPSTKAFFSAAFAWTFEDYGPDYVAFADAGLQGGGAFFKSEHIVSAERGSVLVVFFSEDLEATQETVEKAGGVISKAIFAFTGGRRFHFCEPCGNEYAVWSDSELD